MKLLSSNEWQYRLLRTIIQGVIGVLVANLDLIVSKLNFDPATKTMMVALCMAVLSPVMAEIGRNQEEKAEAELRRKANTYTFPTAVRDEPNDGEAG